MADISLSKAVRTNLLSLQSTATMMARTQERLATGNKVNSALDNPTNFFTASSLNSRAGDLNNLMDSMSNGVKIIESANNGLTAITTNLEQMQAKLREARQDKSFQVASFDVTADSVLNLSGGRLPNGIEVKLPTGSLGEKATLTSSAAYTGPTPAEEDAAGAGAGARTVLTLQTQATDLDNKTITIDGFEITTAADNADAAAAAADLQTKLDDAAGADKYKVSVIDDATDNKIVIENIAVKGAASTAPVVDLGTSAAVKASSTFTYDAARMSLGTLTVDTNGATAGGVVNVSVPGGTVEDFVTATQEQLGDTWVVTNEGNEITITAASAGLANAPVVTLPAATAPSTVFDIDDAAALIASGSITVGDIEVDIAAATDEDDIATAIETALQADASYGANWTATNVAGTITITTTDLGEFEAPTVTADAGIDTASIVTTDGLDAIVADTTAGLAGITQEAVAAATQTFKVTYGDKSVDIVVGVGDQEQMADSINAQLTAADLDLEVTFSATGSLQLAATTAEAKTLAVSGADANAIFGANTVDVGVSADPVLNATKAVDKFVELINSQYGSSIRASNDLGRLRIENLSTNEMNVVTDKMGDGVVTAAEIGGNEARADLSVKFNELKDQLDKLADDASFNGINLLRGDELTITFNETGSSSIKIQSNYSQGINSATLKIEELNASDLDSDETIDQLLAELKTSLNAVRSQASAFGSNLSMVENRQNFTTAMVNTLETGAANLTLADMNEEAANMLALQTRQQLSSSALSMASQADQSILQLLR